MKGQFISFEGIEGVGKSTLQQGLGSALIAKGFDVLQTREPGGTVLGEKLRQAILSPDHETVQPITELLVMFASRAQHVKEVIQPALEKGKIVLCDRFSDTSRAYQGGGRHIPAEWIESLVEMTHPNTHPDLTFWIDLPPEEALQRARKRSIKGDRIENEQLTFFENARLVYQALVKKEPKRFVRLDGRRSPEEILSEALKIFSVHR